MEVTGQFRRRILLVDCDTDFLQVCGEMLQERAYEVVTAQDGFDALFALRGAQPDLLIVELNLPRMSGFELLSVVRRRFPLIAVIALSGEYTPVSVPDEAVCDAFLAKAPNLEFELIEKATHLISESPIRGARARSDLAPVWIPRSSTGYIVLTCPECLRSFSAVQPKKSGRTEETCVCCGADVPFEMSVVEIPPAPPPLSQQDRFRKLLERAQQLDEGGEELRGKPRR
jgi:CheY-like chemotaxis protein